jgi:CheY-like chemotaxis protein
MPKKLLLADDSQIVKRVIERVFEAEGMAVVSVADGDDAVACVERERPDIVLADLTMPGQSGYTIAERIKQTPHLAHIPVVLLAGAFEQVDEARAKAAGCDGVLAKPFEPSMVVGLVRQLLDSSGGAPEAVVAAASPPPASSVAVSAPVASLEEYLDRVDESLTNHGARTPPASVMRRTAEGDGPESPPETAAVDDELTLAVPAPASGGPSLAEAFSALLADELGEAPVQTLWHAPPAGPAVAAPPLETPGEPDAVAPVQPAPRATDALAGVAPPAVSDDMLDELARRVAERLAHREMREIVAATVLDVAERLVREEIERIKAQTAP